MVRIAITVEAIARTLPVGSVAYEAAPTSAAKWKSFRLPLRRG
jgi:hypothetical protein